MMFISGIKKEEVKTNLSIEIPLYHRASIAFMSGSEVYYITRKFESNKVMVRELILSTIIPSSWHLIRKITITSIESPGIINTITDKLSDLKINVHIEEALATQIGAIFTITLIVDLSVFLHEHHNKYNIGDKVPVDVIAEIETELKNLTNPYTSKPIMEGGSIYIKELTFPESISNITTNRNLRHVDEIQFQNTLNQKFKIKNGIIAIQNKTIAALNLNEKLPCYYAIFSDTEEKYVKILFFDPDQTVAFIDIHHDNAYGAIAAFTKIIYKENNFNIIASYSHQQILKETAHWFAIIDISEKPQDFFQTTLDKLKTCSYGPPDTLKKVRNVFLVEMNKEEIPQDAILRYGQNSKTTDGDITSVYIKKKKIIYNLLKEFGVRNYLKHPDDFIQKHNLHHTNSLKTLLTDIIGEMGNEKVKKIKRLASWTIPVFLALIISFLIFPEFKKKMFFFIEHNIIEILILILALLVIKIKEYLKNRVKKYQ